MDMSMGMLSNRDYAKYFWYTISGVVGVYTVANIMTKVVTRSRLRNAKQSRQNPCRPRLLGLYSPFAFLSATLREMSYPQPLLFKRHPFLNPPPLGYLYLVALYLILILILLLHDSIVSGVMYYETIAYRAAWISVCQIPLLFLLAMKSSILGFLIGSSHERLNWLHRTVARCLLLTVTVHFSFFWREWWIYRAITSELQTMTMVKYGMSAWFVLIWIVISSFAPIRNIRYEVFVVQHIISFVAFITLILFHVPDYAKVYIYIPIGFYAFDRVVRTLRIIYRNVSLFHRGTRGVLAAKARITALPGHATRITISNPPLRNWTPGQHIFVSFPGVSPLQSHPFTIASAPESGELSFVVRAHAGFSRRLYNRATSCLPTTSSPHSEKSFPVILDGPYGRPPNFLQYDTLVLIAGSTGVTFTMPILMHALQTKEVNCVRRIQFIWIVKSGTHFEWFASEIERALELAEEKRIALDVKGYVTCEPSYTTNFPIRHVTKPKETGGCCCCQKVDESETQSSEIQEISSTDTLPPITTNEKVGLTDEKILSSDEISLASDSSSEQFCKCNCSAGVEESPISITTGRPDLHAILDRNLILARGETGVAVCGPQGLMARTRCVVAELSDSRGCEKGTGAHGVALFGEGFGW